MVPLLISAILYFVGAKLKLSVAHRSHLLLLPELIETLCHAEVAGLQRVRVIVRNEVHRSSGRFQAHFTPQEHNVEAVHQGRSTGRVQPEIHRCMFRDPSRVDHLPGGRRVLAVPIRTMSPGQGPTKASDRPP